MLIGYLSQTIKKMTTQLSVEISNDQISGLKRKMIHIKLEIDQDLQMTHWRKIVFYEKLSGDTYGRPILQVISENDSLTDEQKSKLISQYEPQLFCVRTSGSVVDAYGNEVAQLPDNTFPVGSLPELEWWQNLPLSILGAPSKCSEVVYGALMMSMDSMDNQNRV